VIGEKKGYVTNVKKEDGNLTKESMPAIQYKPIAVSTGKSGSGGEKGLPPQWKEAERQP